MVPVTLSYLAGGGCGATTCAITSITSSEPVTGPGDATTPDWEIVDAKHVKLRAEQNGTTPRVYSIVISCHDGSGQTETRTVKVKVTNQESEADDD
jgi:hypothetical protein